MLRLAILVAAIWLLLSPPVAARLIEDWPYKRLFKEADLVVIAEATSTKPTEDAFAHSGWKQIRWAGRDASFKVKAILKGSLKSESLTVLHFHIAELKADYLIDGPLIANFKKRREYVLFLRRRKDGRFECVSGQVDPILSVREMSIPFHASAEITRKSLRAKP